MDFGADGMGTRSRWPGFDRLAQRRYEHVDVVVARQAPRDPEPERPGRHIWDHVDHGHDLSAEVSCFPGRGLSALMTVPVMFAIQLWAIASSRSTSWCSSRS